MTLFRCAALALCLAATAVPPVHAHPHVFIQMTSDVVFGDDGKIGAVNVAWVFDPDYTQLAIEGLDINGDGVWTSEELQPLAKENIEALKEYRYFVYAKRNGEKVAWKDVTDYVQTMGVDGRLRMYFTVPLETPVDPRTDEFVYRIYDPSFYIAIEFTGDNPVEALGKPPAGCAVAVSEPPDLSETADTKDMLATKGKDWQPDEEEDFGVMFAQPVSVACKKAAP